MEDVLREYEAEALEIKKALKRFAGLTIEEAKNYGWTEWEDKQQARLWELGFRIVNLRHFLNTTKKGGYYG